MGDIVLSAGVRQNLLSLQGTADLMGLTQNRLATGKKVNSALDNPSSFFTSQSLSFRASDLNSLLDAIGQGQKVLEAADKGLTSLTKLVENAKATARQARQAPQPASTFAALNANSDISTAANLNGTEAMGTFTGPIGAPLNDMAPQTISKTFTNLAETLGTFTGDTLANAVVAGTDNVVINVTVGSTTTAVTVNTAALVGQNAAGVEAAIQAAIDGSAVGAGMIDVTSGGGGNGAITMTALTADVDFTIVANATTDEIGLTTGPAAPANNQTVTSTSLLDQIGISGQSLTINVNGGADQTVTFTNTAGAGNVSTIAEFNTWLQGLTGGASGSIAGTNFSLTNPAGETNTLSLTVSGASNGAALKNALGLSTVRGVGQLGGIGTGTTRTFNSAATLSDLDPTNLSSGGNINITVNGSSQTIGLGANDRLNDIITKLRANATLDNALTFTNISGELRVTAKNADVDFTVNANNVSAALGLTTDNTTANTVDSTSLLDLLNTRLGGPPNGEGTTLTVAVNGGPTQTVTFGSGTGQVSTMEELTTELASLSGVTASLVGTALNFQVPQGTTPTSLTLGGSAITAFGLPAGTQTGTETIGADNSTRSNLQADFNNFLTQIDTLVKDSHYNGINLLNGDNLKVVFNEDGSSFLSITGVVFDSAGLGLNPVVSNGFQSDATIDTTLARLDAGLTTLRAQASKFGSNLSTVQIRQDFTKQLINVLQTGADQLVLADTNEEGANMLALQTRQQLSTTALSLSSQADQAVLRLFG